MIILSVVVLIVTFFVIKKFIKDRNIKKSLQVDNKQVQPQFKNKWEFLLWFLKNNFLKTFILVFGYLSIGTVLYTLFSYIFLSRPHIDETLSSASYQDNKIVYDVYFNVPINTEKLNLKPNTEIPLEVESTPIIKTLPFSKHLQIIVNQNIEEDKILTPYFADVSPILGKTKNEYSFEYHSPEAPQVVTTYPKNEEVDVQIQNDIMILFDKDITNNEWSTEVTPYFEHTVSSNNNKVIIRPISNLQQTTEYTIKLFRTPVQVNAKTNEIVNKDKTLETITISFSTVKSPEVLSFSPHSSYLYDGTNIEIEFNTTILFTSFLENVSIDPVLNGEWKMKNEKTVEFISNDKYQKNTKYIVKIASGLKNTSGGTIENDINLEFNTPGKVKMIRSTPVNGSQKISVKTNSISIEFDQPVDKKSVESNFSISPHINGTFSWNGNRVTYSMSQSLSYGQSYTVSIKPQIIAISGLNSDSTISIKFTTEQQVTLLNVPWLKQSRSHTCNITAAAMVLQYRGVNATEYTVRAAAGDEDPLQEHLGIGGNPYKGWVNYYGTYWTRISQVISSYGVSNSIKTEWNVVDLAKEVEKGNPSILFWQNGASDPYWKTWTTPDGTQIWGINGMHSEVVVGFTGSSDNPTGFYTNDPWRGKNRYYSVGTFKGLWARLRNNSAGMPGNVAIVIY